MLVINYPRIISKFMDLDTTKLHTSTSLTITLNGFLVIDMTTMIQILIGIHNNKTIGIMPILFKPKSMVIMLDMTIQRRKMMVIHLHMK